MDKDQLLLRKTFGEMAAMVVGNLVTKLNAGEQGLTPGEVALIRSLTPQESFVFWSLIRVEPPHGDTWTPQMILWGLKRAWEVTV